MSTRKSICDSIVDSIITKIRNKELKPGDKLPNEVAMAEEYGVSRISLREAIKTLSAKGLIITKHGEGSFINEYNSEMLAETLNNISLLNDTSILEMLQLRKVMETEAAKLCALNATQEELALICYYKDEREKYCALPKDEQNDEVNYKKYEMDNAFHLAIAEGAHNDIFTKFIETIQRTIMVHQQLASTQSDQINNSTYFHKEIVNALLSRDSQRASELMYEHIANIEKNFLDTSRVLSG